MNPDELYASLVLLGFKPESSYIPMAYAWAMHNNNIYVKYRESSKFRPYCISSMKGEYTNNWYSEEYIWATILKQIQTQ